MSATKIAAAFERWYKLQTATYPGDIPAADNDERHALKKHIAGMRAVCLPDALAKVRLLIETEKGYGREEEMLTSIATDLEHAMSASPELVALANELAVAVDRFNISGADRPIAITEAYKRTWRKVEAFAPRSIADVLAKAHAGALHYGEGIPKKGEEMYASDRIVLQMIADLDRLATAKVMA